MRNIGTNETSSTAGAWVPTPATATSSPSVAASEYAGAVDATPIATLEANPIAPARRPGGGLPIDSVAGSRAGATVVAILRSSHLFRRR
jgi:hypothetical protein